ncbi:hypothetical protein GCM10017783_25460 [Deinococcus piscis]|uniref:Uncharacterized protein n=2 Tax=Deinococcus piscis TaxID=394230 RepID=A0ABQ3KBY7_9DEIO|nr:hypothetical protein GCM10017783_25460 [Deinococcus piscis]
MGSFVDYNEYTGGVIAFKSQFTYGEEIFTKSNVFDDMSYSCTKLTFLGQLNNSAVIKRTHLSGTISTSNFMHSVIKESLIQRNKDAFKFSMLSLVCSESVINPTTSTSETYYISLNNERAAFTIGDFWNQIAMNIDLSDSFGTFGFTFNKN